MQVNTEYISTSNNTIMGGNSYFYIVLLDWFPKDKRLRLCWCDFCLVTLEPVGQFHTKLSDISVAQNDGKYFKEMN